MQNIPFCYKYVNFINFSKDNKMEKYIIFTSSMQINLLKKCTQIFIDGTFKICPKTFYQVINIGAFLPDIDAIMPIFLIPTTGKSEVVYHEIFSDVKKILIENNINITKITNKFMIDFEIGIQKALKNTFENILINGCYFHFVKLLWGKAKKLGLCTKEKIKHTKILIFILKIIPFMKIDEKKLVFKKIQDFYEEDKNNKYYSIIKYYKKNWINNPYINYYELSKEEYYNRTNNYLESFHHVLNNMIEVFHPKLSYLISKYKNYLINIYIKLKESLINNVPNKRQNFSIINDILNYLKCYNLKYKTDLNIHIIIQGDESDNAIITKVCNYILNLFFGIEPEDYDNENSSEESSDNNNSNNLDDTDLEFKDLDNKSDEFSEENDDSADILYFDEFNKKKLAKKRCKRNYNEAFGEDNELIKFYDNLNLIKLNDMS